MGTKTVNKKWRFQIKNKRKPYHPQRSKRDAIWNGSPQQCKKNSPIFCEPLRGPLVLENRSQNARRRRGGVQFYFILAVLRIFFMQQNSRTKNQPKEEVFGTDIRRSSARISRPKTSVRAVKILKKKNKYFGADIHDPKARTSMTLRVFQKLRSEKTLG